MSSPMNDASALSDVVGGDAPFEAGEDTFVVAVVVGVLVLLVLLLVAVVGAETDDLHAAPTAKGALNVRNATRRITINFNFSCEEYHQRGALKFEMVKE